MNKQVNNHNDNVVWTDNKAVAVAGYLLDWLQTTASLLMSSITENFRGVRNKAAPGEFRVVNDITLRLPSWLSRGKEPSCQRRRWGFDPRGGKICWRRKWQPTPVFLPGKSHERRNLAGYREHTATSTFFLFFLTLQELECHPCVKAMLIVSIVPILVYVLLRF